MEETTDKVNSTIMKTTKRQHLNGATSDILLSLAVITVPMVMLGAVLLSLIYQN